MPEIIKILLMGLGCSSLLGLGSCMLGIGSMAYFGSRAVESAKDMNRRNEPADLWDTDRSYQVSGREVPRTYNNGVSLNGSDDYGEPAVVLKRERQ